MQTEMLNSRNLFNRISTALDNKKMKRRKRIKKKKLPQLDA
jgi:hypothetical protein